MATNNHNSKSLNNKILSLMADAGIRPSGYSREFLLALTPASFAALDVKNQYDAMSRLSWLALECQDERFKSKFLELYPTMKLAQDKISQYVQLQLDKEMLHA